MDAAKNVSNEQGWPAQAKNEWPGCAATCAKAKAATGENLCQPRCHQQPASTFAATGWSGEKEAVIIAPPVLRCAIYTRTTSGRSHSSLTRQRAACRAYIKHRRHAGWIALSDLYSDGRVASDMRDFPALERLLAEVEQRRIDRLVIDQLSCIYTSEFDLSRLMMITDYGGCALVVARQDIDGATPVGRQILVTLSALTPMIVARGSSRLLTPANEQRLLAKLLRLRAAQAVPTLANKTEGQSPCGS